MKRTYTVHLEYFQDGNQKGYMATVPALPGCITWGKTLTEARAMAADAVAGYLESLQKAGEPIPADLPQAKKVYVENLSVGV